LALAFVLAQPALAQMCERPLCTGDDTYARSGVRDGRPYGVCASEPNWLGHRSHRLVECPAGHTLNTRTGQCVDDGCSGGCGQIRPVCPYGSTFQRQGEDAAGEAYAVCGSSSGIGPYKSHTPVTCREGWRLIAGGRCQKECGPVSAPIVSPLAPEVIRRPDLVIKSAYLRTAADRDPVSVLVNGQSYLACFTIANQGNDVSGPFRIGGGGLGVSAAPYQNQTALAASRTRDGCLTYPTTPGPGRYTVQLTVDLLNAVTESREDNNTYDLRVVVESLLREPKPKVPGIEPVVPIPPGKIPPKPDGRR
jgi:hypothetical protein